MAAKEDLPWTCPSSAVCGDSLFWERLRRLQHLPGNAPLAHSCFGLTPQGEAYINRTIKYTFSHKLTYYMPCPVEIQALLVKTASVFAYQPIFVEESAGLWYNLQVKSG
ncbi:MAG: hypothetical protein SOW00_01805 [Oscillospiraceae bacterium]|nr:hypothetical protein [Eubacteriales bacterium]MDY2617513.1 hypothetical protein [Oscillospiraceae bacterium]